MKSWAVCFDGSTPLLEFLFICFGLKYDNFSSAVQPGGPDLQFETKKKAFYRWKNEKKR